MILVLKLPLSYIVSIFPACPQVRVSLTPTLFCALGGWPLEMASPEFLGSLTSGWT